MSVRRETSGSIAPSPKTPRRLRTPWAQILLFATMAALLTAPAFAQAIPYHADPDAREILPNLQPVPAIRFLTTADFPPFNFRDQSGELVGFNIDLARRICIEVNVACTIQAWPWEQAATALADSQGDALIAGLAITLENGELFDFSAVYLALPGRFVARAGSIDSFRPERLAGQRIAVRAGSAHEDFMERYLPEAERVGFDDEIAALEAVKDGIVQAYFGDAMRASFWLNDNLACCGFAGDAYFRPRLFGEGLAIAVPGAQDRVRHAIDWALVRLKNNGALDELYLRWFPVGYY
ncbi:transporter substrate-binding domain-containing protein [Devosia sp. YIM 151766]|uniref:transporter substrate-binding domain-containing protein n=1 Tax=Devosia sp. YIM 151766 TaxID=3017325 RepID=UPI00255C3D82|nr:transporter substrate-binding domain-containing protein [Devosia sp. YIM 151766]WIY52967.1 transporter substrate-binding domain-containing protein [Devosia sp. YIM 151766]